MEYLWEAKNLVNKVKHAVLNLTEMESKVMTATNDDSWGASSTLMLEISRGTSHFQQFNEIMNIIVKRLSEREPQNWRKIYKALTLLEYLVKNGSEKVVDFARDKIPLIKSLRNFNYIDEKNKDQGLNVKTRAKEIVELLSSTERIKEERKKAKANRSKYIGIGSEPSGFGGDVGFGSSNSSRFGNEGGFGSSNSRFGSSFACEELGGGLDFQDEPPSRSRFNDIEIHVSSGWVHQSQKTSSSLQSKSEPPLPAAPVVDLFSFDDPSPLPQTSLAVDEEWSTFQGPTKNSDDFGDFQSVVASQSSTSAIPPPSNGMTTNKSNSSMTNQNLFDMGDFNFTPNNPATPFQNGNTSFISKPLSEPSNKAPNNTSIAKTSEPTNLWSQHANILSLDGLSLGTNSSSNTRSVPLSMNQMASQQSVFSSFPQVPPKMTTSSFTAPPSNRNQNNTPARPLNPVDLSEFDSLI